MDVWRYSDWYGRRSVPDVLNSYGQVWRWRDWIVRSLNGDRPYDEMVRLMLAADELAPRNRDDLVATGFVVRNFFRWNYNNWMRDNVEHTAKAFLGLTLNCCHCHDHKYDPITQKEYYQLYAFFNSCDEPKLPLPTPEQARRLEELHAARNQGIPTQDRAIGGQAAGVAMQAGQHAQFQCFAHEGAPVAGVFTDPPGPAAAR